MPQHVDSCGQETGERDTRFLAGRVHHVGDGEHIRRDTCRAEHHHPMMHRRNAGELQHVVDAAAWSMLEHYLQ